MFFVLFIILVCGCSSSSLKENKVENNWSKIVSNAKNTTVNFYGWGGDPQVNKYIDSYLAPLLKDKYNIKINRVSMLPPEYIDIITTEIDAKKNGNVDVVWINGNNFSIAKEKGILMKDIPKYLPNYKNIDENDKSLHTDFNVPVDGYEVPFGAAQLAIIKNNKKAESVHDTATLLDYVKKNKNRFTYPNPTTDFVGSAYIRNVILEQIGEKEYYSIDNDLSDEELLEKIKPGLDYLNKINPYLWREGKTYPQSSTLLDNMYSDNEVDFTISYSPFHAASRVKNKEFTKDSKTFILGKKSIGNTHYLSIASNSNNIEGALVFINEVLSVEAQLKKYNPYGWGDFPIFSLNKLNNSDKKKFESYEIPESVLGYNHYEKNRVIELDATITARIDKLWEKHVLK